MMTEGRDVVKQLRKDGIKSLFTNRFLQNMKGSFEKCLNRYTREIESEPYARRHTVMILLGYLNFKASKNDKAVEWFEGVLKEQPSSINALLNLLFTYEQMKLPSKAGEYEKKIQDILSNDSLAERSKAYAKYELAGVMSAVNAQLQTGGFQVADDLFQEAILCEEVPQDVKVEWFLGYAYFCLNTDNTYGKTQDKYFKKSMEYFYRIVISKQPTPTTNDDNSALQELWKDTVSKAWCFIGSLMSRYDRPQKYIRLGDVEGLECPKEFSGCTVQSCMKKANEKATLKNAPMILRRTGLVYMDMGKTWMPEAEKCLRQAVDLDGESGYGHNLLGQWFLKNYEYVCAQGSSNDKTHLLSEAIRCFEVAIEKGFDMWYCLRELAKAYFMKGNPNAAIGRCQKSEQHGGNLDSELYELWAKIYIKMECPDSAKEMSNKAQKLARGQYDSEKHDFGVVYHDEDVDHITALITDLEKQLHLRCFFLDRDILCGNNTVETWCALEKMCHCILVFCSDNFFPGTSVAYNTLTSIINVRCDRGERNTIIPAKLPGCKDIPFVLNPFRAIEADGSDKFKDEIKRKFESFTIQDNAL